MATVLTDAAVRKFAAHAKRREIRDIRTAGLHLVVQSSGAKSWCLRFRRPGGRPAKLTLGPVDLSGKELVGEPVLGQPLTLAAARALAADIHRQRALGRDVIADYAAVKHRRKSESDEAATLTFGVLARQYVGEYAKPETRRWRETARVLGLVYALNGEGEPTESKDGLVQRWANRDVRSIDGHDVYQVIDEAKRLGIPGRERHNKKGSNARGRLMARTLSKLFSWLVEHRKITTNPARGVHVPPAPDARERKLSDQEIRWLWLTCDQIGYPFGQLCKLLLLTGSRREEVRCMMRAEISEDGSTWDIPGSRTKNRKPHEMPLSSLAREIIAELPHIENRSGFVFTTGQRPVSGFSKAKSIIDAKMLAIARKEHGKAFAIEPWRLHDLRRTCASGMQKLGIRVEVIERCLNHVSGAYAGVVGIYQREPMMPERRDALERWAQHICGIVADKPANVVALPRKGA